MYNVFQKTKLAGDSDAALAVTEKESEIEAKSLFHQIMASAYANPNLDFALCEIINDWGNIELMERYDKPYLPEE